MLFLPSIALVVALAAAAFWLARSRILAAVSGQVTELRSLPGHYGWYAALASGLPGLAVVFAWLLAGSWILDQWALAELSRAVGGGESELSLLLNDVHNLADGRFAVATASDAVQGVAQRFAALRSRAGGGVLGLALALSVLGGALALSRMRPALVARVAVERVARGGLMLASTFAILVTLGILLSLVFEAARFFEQVPVSEFLFGLHWSPQTAIRADQVGSSGSFGAVPIFVGTLLITAIAMLVAVPVGLLAAIYMTFYAAPRTRDVAKPLLEILAGVPTVVYGFFAALIVAPLLRGLGTSLGLDVASESALTAGLVMGVMIVPLISSLSDDAITAVPISLRDGSFGLGATRSETIRLVILPAALPGIVGGILLAISRAIGETMIVVMAAGLAANLSLNPFDAVTTVTVQIVTLLTGDQEFDSAKTLSAFALGLVLFIVTLTLNVFALRIVARYREKYD